MVKGMSLIHISIVSLLGRVALLPSLRMSLCVVSWSCRHSAAVPPHCHLCGCCHRLIVVVLACHPHVSWLCCSCAMASSSCVFLASATVVLVPHHRFIIMLCVSKVGWDEWGGYSLGCLIIACVRLWVLAIVCVHFQVFFIVWGCAGGCWGS